MKKIILLTKLLIVINAVLLLIIYYLSSSTINIAKSNGIDYYSNGYVIVKKNLQELLELHSSVLYHNPDSYNKLEYLGSSLDALYNIKEDRKSIMSDEQLNHYYLVINDTENLFLKYYGSVSAMAQYDKKNYQDKNPIYKAKLVFLKERFYQDQDIYYRKVKVEYQK